MSDLTTFIRIDRPYLIAEIGNNHEGDIEVAKELIYAAKDSGVDAVKFQAIVPETLVSADQETRLNQLNKFCFSLDQLADLSEIAVKLELEFFSSVFDIDLIPGLLEIQNIFKISSGDNTYTDLIDAVAKTEKPTIISTGGLSLEEIAILREQFLLESKEPRNLALLHCISNYPTLPENAQLSILQNMQKRFPDTLIGYSDHTLGNNACFLAAAMGAKIIEKHFTLSHMLSDFRDHQLSADPVQMTELVKLLPEAFSLMGIGRTDQDRSDVPMIGVCRKAIAKQDICQGEVFSRENVTWVRITEDAGISDRNALYGLTASTSIQSGEIINYKSIKL